MIELLLCILSLIPAQPTITRLDGGTALPVSSISESGAVTIQATLTDAQTQQPLRGYLMLAQADAGSHTTIHADEAGVIHAPMKWDEVYELMFVVQGYLPHKIIFDLFGLSSSDVRTDQEVNFALPMLKDVDGIPEYLLEEPMGYAAYSSAEKKIVFDNAFGERRRAVVQQAIDGIEGR
jgi:hypothetical protein